MTSPDRPREFDCVLIANRGEIAVRIARTARRLGYRTVAAYADVDCDAPHVRAADDAVGLGAATAYLEIDAVLDAARRAGAQAIHPGYGFLSERAEFAERCALAGIAFVGPSAAAMRALGDKAHAKRVVAALGVPLVPGYHGDDQRDDAFAREAARIGYPVMVKAAAGGGGRGMRVVAAPDALVDALGSARREAASAFGDDRLLLERAVVAPRHVEVQVVADRFGSVVHLGERECSVQRRFQKLLEEAPSPAVDPALRERLGATACAVARAVGYEGAGTVEFILDGDAFYFIEANARLQVEHPVTEAVTGIDLVEWQLRIARGEPLPCAQDDVRISGWAIEARLCAEDPARGFLPTGGRVVAWSPPANVRVDAALAPGIVVGPHFDSLLAKVIAHGPARDDARRALARALDETVLLGVKTNAAFLAEVLRSPAFASGHTTTALLDEFVAHPPEPRDADDAALAAATLRADALAHRAGFGTWTGWSANVRPRATLVLDDEDGARRTVRLDLSPEGARTTLDGRTEDVVLGASPSRARRAIRIGPHAYEAAFAEDGDACFVALGARTYAFIDRTHAASAPAQRAAADGALRAPTGGRVLAVHVAAGDDVEAGALAVVLEAMKMEHRVLAPHAGRVAHVAVAPGDYVAAQTVLATFTASEADAT